MGSLFVTAGPDKGELFSIAAAEVTVGRDPGCSFQLTDGMVSRQHFRITSDEAAGLCVITDLGSANGTIVNGQKLGGPHALKDGDTIGLGGTTLRFAARNISRNPGVDRMQHIVKQSERQKGTITDPPLPPPRRRA